MVDPVTGEYTVDSLPWTERLSVSIGYSATVSDKIYTGAHQVVNAGGMRTEFQQWALNLQFIQNHRHRWSLILPRLEMEQRSNTAVLARASGIGDILLTHIWQPWDGKPWGLLAGLEFPTGEQLDAPPAGVVPPSLVQLGSGTWDPLLGVLWSGSISDSLAHNARVVGIFPIGASDAELNPGNLLQAYYSLAWQAHSTISASLGLEGVYRSKDWLQSAELIDTGSTVFALRPGLRFSLSDTSIFVGARLPITYNVGDTQMVPGPYLEIWLGFH